MQIRVRALQARARLGVPCEHLNAVNPTFGEIKLRLVNRDDRFCVQRGSYLIP